MPRNSDPSKLSIELLAAVREAGMAALSWQQSGFAVMRKANNDLLTQADLAANDILKARLMTVFPETGWLSEESADDEKRLTCEWVWVVDPVDGTIEFATGVPEYAVSVALVKSGLPVLTCVFNPATNELFHAIKGQGAWLNDKKIYCDHQGLTNKLHLLASRSEYKRGEWDRFLTAHQVTPVGSIAYKLALIAAGQAHATFSLGPKSEWDIAAGVLLVTEAGGFATDQMRQPFIFNQANIRVNGVVAGSKELDNVVFHLLGSG